MNREVQRQSFSTRLEIKAQSVIYQRLCNLASDHRDMVYRLGQAEVSVPAVTMLFE